VAIAKLFFYAQEAKMEESDLKNCCGEHPTIKQKYKKNKSVYRIECECCGLIIGNYNDSYQAWNNWNDYHTMKEQGETK